MYSTQVCENDVIKVHVHNRMYNEEAEAIHWHGFHMRGTQHMDGVPHVTQCPIMAGEDFTYEFTATEPGRCRSKSEFLLTKLTMLTEY